MSELKVVVYTDGSCLKNPGGQGGWAALLMFDGEELALTGGFTCTTNNRMELMGVLKALEFVTQFPAPYCIQLYSDSRYVVDAVNKGWLDRWAASGWFKNNSRQNTKNVDLWQPIHDLLKRHSVKIDWVPAHRGIKGNERVDRLSREQANRDDLPPDPGYPGSI